MNIPYRRLCPAFIEVVAILQGRLGTMKRRFHLARARYFGVAKTQAQMCWAALGMNLLKAHRKLEKMQFAGSSVS